MIRARGDAQVAPVFAAPQAAAPSTLPPEHDELGLIQTCTPTEAARALRVARQTIYSMIRRGQLPALHVGSGVRLRVGDVNALVEGRR